MFFSVPVCMPFVVVQEHPLESCCIIADEISSGFVVMMLNARTSLYPSLMKSVIYMQNRRATMVYGRSSKPFVKTKSESTIMLMSTMMIDEPSEAFFLLLFTIDAVPPKTGGMPWAVPPVC